jgi:N-acetylmuramoyl-L-alanine amidase
MYRFISVVAILCMLSSLYVLYRVDQIETTVTSMDVMAYYAPQYEPLPLPVIEVEEPYTIPILEVDPHDLLCLQKNIYFESRDQGTIGMISTAWVTFNRVDDKRFRNTICEVVYRAKTDKRGFPIRNKCQFSWYCDGKTDEPDLENEIEYTAWILSGSIARRMILTCRMGYKPEECPDDPTHGAIFYHNDTVENFKYTKTTVVGKHTYYVKN